MNLQDVQTEVLRLADTWAAAERGGDAAVIEGLLAEEFIGIGPLGFMLSKQEWLARHRSGDLTYDAVDLDEVIARVYTAAAIVIGRLAQKATYRGNRVDTELRTTLVFVQENDQWRLASLHFSPIGQPPSFAPSQPAPARR